MTCSLLYLKDSVDRLEWEWDLPFGKKTHMDTSTIDLSVFTCLLY